MVPRGRERVAVGSYYVMGSISVGEDGKVHELDGGDGCTQSECI